RYTSTSTSCSTSSASERPTRPERYRRSGGSRCRSTSSSAARTPHCARSTHSAAWLVVATCSVNLYEARFGPVGSVEWRQDMPRAPCGDVERRAVLRDAVVPIPLFVASAHGNAEIEQPPGAFGIRRPRKLREPCASPRPKAVDELRLFREERADGGIVMPRAR